MKFFVNTKAAYLLGFLIIFALLIASGCGGSSSHSLVNNNNQENQQDTQDKTQEDNQENQQDKNNQNETQNDNHDNQVESQDKTQTESQDNEPQEEQDSALTFDSSSYTTGTVNGVTYRAYSDIIYVKTPVNSSYQKMSIYIPETYFSGGTLNGYTADTAPIFMPNNVGGYMKGGISSPRSNNSIGIALSKGLVAVSPALRGRDTDYGTAPACIVDYKAAVRYLRYNKKYNKLPAGDTDKIISSGTSAGGAISALLGAAGNSGDYDEYLDELGAANASDDIFASMCYCPITNLDNADSAYEWTFGGNAALAANFITYLNGLNLEYSLNSDGSGTFKDYLDSLGTYTTRRDKSQVPAFDRLDLSSAENNEFGDKHFTEFGYSNNTASNNAMADSAIIKAMNPMNYIGTADTAQYWRIRHGLSDSDTSLAVPAILALKLNASGFTVDFKGVSGQGHGGDYDLDELFSWIDEICK